MTAERVVFLHYGFRQMRWFRVVAENEGAGAGGYMILVDVDMHS
jgi:hypothetical protein